MDFSFIKKNKVGLFVFLTILFFVLIFALNRNFPLYMDDWDYMMVFGYNGRYVTSLSDIILSQYNHYFMWGGRSVVHVIVQFLLMIDPVLRQIVNSLIYVLFIFLICRVANVGRVMSFRSYLFVFFLSFLTLPTFPTTVLWATGSGNYLCGALISLPFILKYYNNYLSENFVEDKTAHIVLFFLYSIVVGWTNENLAITLVLGVLCYIIYLKHQGLKIPSWVIVGFVGLIIGSVIMILAPGNQVRLKSVDDIQHFTDKSFFNLLKMRIAMLIYVYRCVPTLFILSIVFVLFFVINIVFNRATTKKLKGAVFFFVLAYISIIVMLATPVFPPRATFCTTTFLIIAASILFVDILQSDIPSIKYAMSACVLILSIIFVFKYNSLYLAIQEFRDTLNQRSEIVLEAKKIGKSDIILTDPIKCLDILYVDELSADPNFWANQSFCRYYGIRSVELHRY